MVNVLRTYKFSPRDKSKSYKVVLNLEIDTYEPRDVYTAIKIKDFYQDYTQQVSFFSSPFPANVDDLYTEGEVKTYEDTYGPEYVFKEKSVPFEVPQVGRDMSLSPMISLEDLMVDPSVLRENRFLARKQLVEKGIEEYDKRGEERFLVESKANSELQKLLKEADAKTLEIEKGKIKALFDLSNKIIGNKDKEDVDVKDREKLTPEAVSSLGFAIDLRASERLESDPTLQGTGDGERAPRPGTVESSDVSPEDNRVEDNSVEPSNE